MAPFQGVYRHELDDQTPSRTVPLKATNADDAATEAAEGMREDEKGVDVEEVDDNGFKLDGSKLSGPNRLG